MEGTMLLLCSGAGNVPVHSRKQNLGSATCSQTRGKTAKQTEAGSVTFRPRVRL